MVKNKSEREREREKEYEGKAKAMEWNLGYRNHIEDTRTKLWGIKNIRRHM